MTGEQNENYDDDDFLDDFALDEDLFADEADNESDETAATPGAAAPHLEDDDEFALPDELAAEDEPDEEPMAEDLGPGDELALDGPAADALDDDVAALAGEPLSFDGDAAGTPAVNDPTGFAAEDLEAAVGGSDVGPGGLDDLNQPLQFEDDEPGVEASAEAPAGEPDSDDLLFEDHMQRVEASETFPGKQQFDEGNESTWDDSALELDPPTERPAAAEPEFAGEDVMGSYLDAASAGATGGTLAGDDAFEIESDSELEEAGETDFDLDSDTELEIVGGDTFEVSDAAGDGTPQEAFVVDDGSGPGAGDWQDQDAELPTLEPVAEDAGPMQVLDAASELARMNPDADPDAELDGEAGEMEYEYIGELSESAGEAEGPNGDESWEALPEHNVDQLAEVEEEGQADHSFVPEPLESAASADPEEHDELYTEAEDDPEVVGGHRDGPRLLGTVTALAALLIVGLGTATLVLRPELVGLSFGPEKVEIVQLARPVVKIAVEQPPLPVAVGATTETPTGGGDEPVGGDPGTGAPTTGGTTDPGQTDPGQTDPGQTDPGQVDPGQSDPGQTEPGQTDPGQTDPGQTDPGQTDPGQTDPGVGVAAGGEPESTGPQVVPVPTPVPGETSSWPVPVTARPTGGPDRAVDRTALLRAGDDLMIGNSEDLPEREGMDGLRPGARAFAQLENGNFFIGSVKAVDTEFVTLRVDDGGEVSIKRAHLARLTGLGTADYVDLQKATAGAVRLRNNNRLVGAILESIRDDHIILGTKKNRVMLPRSAINEIEERNNDSGVRIGTTSEEDAWLRAVSERQLEERRRQREEGTPAAPTGGQ